MDRIPHICQTSKGKKTSENQDNVITSFNRNIAIFAVFDGHGLKGRQFAQSGAQVLEAKLLEKSKDKPCSLPDLVRSIEETDYELKDAVSGSGGSTIACAVFKYEKDSSSNNTKLILMVANAGDSPIVIFQNGKPLRLSEEHNTKNQDEIKRIEAKGGHIIKGRVSGSHQTTRGLGDFSLKDYITAEPYAVEIVIGKFDEYLIIGSDGLWDGFTDQHIIDLINQYSPLSLHPKAIALVREAQRLSRDDISFVLVDLRQLGH